MCRCYLNCSDGVYDVQDLQQVMVSGPNLNETSIVSGGYGGSTEGIIPTGSIKGACRLTLSHQMSFSLILHFAPDLRSLSCFVLLLFFAEMLLGPAILYNEEYFERRCGNAPKPGVVMHLVYKLLFISFLFQHFLSLPTSEVHAGEDFYDFFLTYLRKLLLFVCRLRTQEKELHASLRRKD